MGAARKLRKETGIQCGSPNDKLNRIIDKHSIRGIGGPERSINPILVTSSLSRKLTISSYTRERCLRSSSLTMTTKPDGVDRFPESKGLIEVWNEDIVDVKPEKKASPPPFKKIIEKMDKKHEKEQKSNGKRYLPLPDIYTPIDRTSRCSTPIWLNN